MPGTELTPERRAELVRQLTIVGWLVLGGPIGFFAFQLDRVRRVSEQQFATVWDQRIEVLSFLMLPPNLVTLAPVAAVAVTTAWLAGADPDPWLSTLVRLVAGLAITLGVFGALSIVSILLRDDVGTFEFDGIALRLGGISMAAGLALVCRLADRIATPE